MNIAQELERAVLHHRSGRHADAQRAYERVLVEEPENADAHHLLGQLLVNENRATEAVHHLEKAVELFPTEALYLRTLGIALRRQNRFQDSARAFARADAAKPDDPVIKTNLADTLSAAGLYQQAVPFYRQALSLQADSPIIRRNLAHCLSMMGQHSDAAREYRTVLQQSPEDSRSHVRLGDVLRELGKTDEAVAAYEAAMESGADRAELLTKIGIALQQAARFDDAERYFRGVLEGAPSFVPAFVNLARQHQFTENDPLLGQMAGVLAEEVREGWRAQLEFALARALDQIGASDRAFDLLLSANRAMAAEHPFDPTSVTALVEGLVQHCGHEWRASLTGGAEDDRPVFIVGMQRSGVSLVEELLTRHPDVARSSHTALVEQLAGEVCGQGRLTSGLGEKLAAISPSDAERLQARVKKSFDGQGTAKRIVTGRPGYFIHLGLIARLIPGARIIHCQRDPVDTCLSNYFQSYNKGHRYSYDLSLTGQFYLAYRQLMDHWRDVGVLPILDVDYENLVTAPEEEMRRVLSFLGLDWNASCLDASVNTGAVREGAVWEIRQPITQRYLRRWERYEEHLDPLFNVLASLLPQDNQGASEQAS